MTATPPRAPMGDGSIRQIIDHLAATRPDDRFLVAPARGGETVTFLDLQRRAQGLAGFIAEKGIAKGETVAYALGNSPQAAVTILGILYAGCRATSINLVAGDAVISYVLEHSETRLILANAAGLGALEKCCAGQEPIAGGAIALEPLTPEMFNPALYTADHAPPPTADDGGLLMYTSGTTGRPKGVMLSQSNLIAGGRNTALAHQLTPADCGLCVLPFYHINGLCVTLMGSLVSGGTLVVPDKFSVSSFWHDIIAHGCTWFSVVPTQISYLLHDSTVTPSHTDLAHVRFGRSASAPLSPEVQAAFEAKFNITLIETMGLTETAAQILSNPLPPGVQKIGSPGVAFGNEVIIGDGAQNEMARGREGEVLVRGPNVMQGYLKNPEATSAALTPQGWLRTGDLGRMDDAGYVYITGRLKELIIKGGENIAPREIDEALYCHPDVIEAAAFSQPCQNYGERVEAAVMVATGSAVTEDELIALCVSKLGRFKSPDRIHFLAELPKGPSGKIQRIKLAETLG